MAGDGSEPRYDGEKMATKGIVALTVNYRLGIFGLFAHPELTAESPHRSSGNYGVMDQAAALKWVQENIAAFGGDPNKVTIAGESAGSISVSAQMITPLSKGLIFFRSHWRTWMGVIITIDRFISILCMKIGPSPGAEPNKSVAGKICCCLFYVSISFDTVNL